jgi:diketogulonate reductase-like aldo/keto reductase
VIPKARTKDHLREDIDVFDWDLSDEDFDRIAEKSGSNIERIKYKLKTIKQ